MAPDVIALPPYTEQFHELLGWMDAVHPGQISIVDVGGGGEFYDFPDLVRSRARRMVGVDPDPRVANRPWLDAARQSTVEDYAPTAGETFDIALCVYVLEHVVDPLAFLRAVRSLLDEGGSCFGITPNLWHYFGMASAASARLGVEEAILRRVRPAELVDAYHFPVQYRLNSVRRLSTLATTAGFKSVEIRALEQSGMFETYFPDWLQWWPRAYSAALNRLGWPQMFGTLIFRLGA